MEDFEPDQIILQGELTLSSLSQRPVTAAQYLADCGRNVVLNLQQITQVDSAALALVLSFCQQARHNDQHLSVVGMSSALKALANLYGVAQFIMNQGDNNDG